MKLILVRHGITEGTKRGLHYGGVDIPLLPEGEEELKRRREEKIYPAGARYYASPLQRTHQTLRLLYGEVPFTVVEDFREMHCGEFEMRSEEELQDEPAFQLWKQDRLNNVCPGGESKANTYRRAGEAIDRVLAEAGEEDTVCVVHGFVIRGILQHLIPGWEVDKNYTWPGEGWQLTIEAGRVTDIVRIPFDK